MAAPQNVKSPRGREKGDWKPFHKDTDHNGKASSTKVPNRDDGRQGGKYGNMSNKKY